MRLLEGLAELLFPDALRRMRAARRGAVRAPAEKHCHASIPRGACPRCGAPFGYLVCTECWDARVVRSRRRWPSARSRRRSPGPSCCTRTPASDGSRACSAGSSPSRCRRPGPSGPECVAYVPATKAALRRRGFDHGSAIAAVAGERARRAARDALLRAPPPATSARLAAPQRAANVAGTFVASGRCRPGAPGRRRVHHRRHARRRGRGAARSRGRGGARGGGRAGMVTAG